MDRNRATQGTTAKAEDMEYRQAGRVRLLRASMEESELMSRTANSRESTHPTPRRQGLGHRGGQSTVVITKFLGDMNNG
ncbi:MAG: hypothetical protein KAS32_03055 [Candidatus Peribacteraceae bacterium]|nr:hypothetical protein [Candidatus Peribacteraceae bacterium]